MDGMSGTEGDTYQVTAVQPNGTPVSTVGISSQKVSIRNQIGVVTDVTTSNSGNIFSFTTTPTTFPVGGPYYLQLILTYSGGQITKCQIIPIMIGQSNE